MAGQRIDNAYLRSFFRIPQGPEGDAELEALCDKLTRIKYRHGQEICTIDSEGDCMFFLDSGAAVVLDRDGQQINVMHEGQYFGEYAVLSGQRRLSTVRAYGTAVVYRLGKDDMLEVLLKHPAVYGDMMKSVYAQVTRKHKELLKLSRMHRGILQHPKNQTPRKPLGILLRCAFLAAVFVLSLIFVPTGTAIPVFLLPLLLLLVYVLVTHQTLEALVVAVIYAALLTLRSGLSVSFTDAFLETVGDFNNLKTVFVMFLIGSFVTLIEASGAVTAFKKLVDRKVASPRGVRLSMFGIMAVTSIDDCLNSLCGSGSTSGAAEAQRVSCEDRALMLSFLPTVLCSFVPISLWGIFVIGSITPNIDRAGLSLFLSAIPFNFFSIIAVLGILLFCFDRLPLTRRLKDARKRVAEGGALWPEGSERYQNAEETAVWGRIWNLLLPVVFLALSTLLLRLIFSHTLLIDSACGLVATLIFMFVLYCSQGLMSPEQFWEHLISGVQDMVLPIILYLLTMCFSALLNRQAMGMFFDDLVLVLEPVIPLLPAALFLISTLFAMALGSSWAMYAIGFPVAIRMASAVGISVPLCVGAVCAAGIAGELCCVYGSSSLLIGEALGCDPGIVTKLRLPYAVAFSLISLLLYILAGFIVL